MTDCDYMRRAIELAKKGLGFTNPNPLVGAVIVKEGKIIGEGYHERYGELHAERNAIKSLKESAEGATIYVTLEPCCHYGKTPPCTEAIIENKIAKVVIGSRDPNPLVSGKGASILRTHGIEVVEDFLREECDELNPVFFHYISTKTPYVVMKYAMTADGKIATKTGASKWITGPDSRQEVMKLRHQYMGIMVGIGTVLADDPTLNTRIEGLKSPVRIICDSKLKIPLDSNICRTAGQYKTIVAYAKDDPEKLEKLRKLGITCVKVSDTNEMSDTNEVSDTNQVSDTTAKIDLKKLMQYLGETEKIDSILLEGGGTLNESALRDGIVKEIYAFIAPKIFGGVKGKSPVEGEGVELPSDCYQLEYKSMEQTGDDLMIRYLVR